MSKRLSAVGAGVLAALATACGSGGDGSALEDASSSLGDIHSGRLHMRAVVEPRGVDDGTVGLELRGPFALAEGKELPTARIRYTQIAGARRASATVTSTAEGAFVTSGGATRRLAPADADALRVGRGGGLDALGIDLERWVKGARASEGGRVDGVDTQLVAGSLDLAAAIGDLLALTGGAKGQARLDDGSRRSLRSALRASSVRTWVGKEDGLLRRLRVRADVDLPRHLRGLIGGVEGGRVSFDLEIADPNGAVHVRPPSGA